jgi:uncharacterized protein (DUF486 family)
LVGDNPFHNVSHLTQDRTRLRSKELTYPEYAASLILTSLENGANGFMFSVSEKTLSILDVLREKDAIERLDLCAIVPYAYEYVRLANQFGGIPGLAKNFAKQIFFSGDVEAIMSGVKGVVITDPVSLLKTYLSYEIKRIRSSAGKKAKIHSVLLHEVVTDMALALDLDWFFKACFDFILAQELTPGFNTCNFVYLVDKFRAWGIDLNKIVIAAPFNKVGFQMNPSKEACEKALENLNEPILIAISVLAAGYLKPAEAIDYVASLRNVKGVAIGVSKEGHAQETFKLVKEKLV